MSENNALMLSEQYPESKYNMLVPVQTVAEISDIQRPVLNVVYISTNLDDKEIYVQEASKAAVPEKGLPATPTKYALARKGLLKLMRAAGIRIVSSKAVLPSTCQKCVEVNRNIGKPVNCGSCSNKDVKYTVTIAAPQLTGQEIEYVCSREMIIEDETRGMTDARIKQFMKFRAEHCESKALNRALRAAMLIKSTYLLEEFNKPFVVAYLVPNMDNPDVRAKAIDNFFTSANSLFKGPVKRVKVEVDDDLPEHIDTETGEVSYAPALDAGYASALVVESNYPDEAPLDAMEPPKNNQRQSTYAPSPAPTPATQVANYIVCADCGNEIVGNGSWTPDRIASYSLQNFRRALCPACQRKAKAEQQR